MARGTAKAMWQTVVLGLTAAAAAASLLWSWRLSLRLEEREHELSRLREAAREGEGRAAVPAPPPAPAAPAGDEAGEHWLDELDRRRSLFATRIGARVVPQRQHRGGEPFVLVVEVALMNRGPRDVRLSLKTRENENPLAVRRYLGQPEKLYSAPQPAPAVAGGDGERGARAQIVRADGVETLDFAVPLHEPGLYRLGFRLRGDEITGEDGKAGGAVVWQRHKHVVVA